jgi:hypothetical protein
MRTNLLFIVLCLAFAISGCKRTCYECEKYEYCLIYTIDCPDGSVTPFSDCFDTKSQRDEHLISALSSRPPGCSLSMTNTDNNLLSGNQKEICELEKNVEDAVSDLEVTGYQCVLE